MANAVIISDIVASQPPRESIAADARNSLVINEKQYEKLVAHEHSNISTGNHLSDGYPPPTEEETKTLRKVAGAVPWIGYAFCVVEFAERASYYGAQQIFTNFMQRPLPKGGSGTGAPPKGTQLTAGALNKGLQFANAFVLLFKFLAYAVPILGAWVADTRWGRYKTIMVGVMICGCDLVPAWIPSPAPSNALNVAHIIQIFGALPSVLQAGHGLAPFLIGLFLLAFGAGLFKPNILPTLLDQYRHQTPYVKTLKSGERVIVDPEATINRISLLFYGFVNIGAFFPIASVYAEKRVGFWLAFLLPGIIYFLLPIMLILTYKHTYRPVPNGTVVDEFFKIIRVAVVRNKFRLWKKDFWEAAKPSVLASAGITTWKGKEITWSDGFVRDVVRTLSACKMFLYFVPWYWNDGGIGAVQTAQGSSMVTNGVPNDLLNNFNPLTIIIFIPFLTHLVYPALRKANMMPGRVTRITFGFTLAWISGILGAVTQWWIYKHSPCGYNASDCSIGTGVAPLSVWWQLPNVVLGAISECFCQVTAYEIAYARSPRNMKSLVMAIFLFQNALASAMAQILTPAIKDPNLIWVWAGPAIALAVVTVIFYFRYKAINNDEFMTAEEMVWNSGQERDAETAPIVSEKNGHVELEPAAATAPKI